MATPDDAHPRPGRQRRGPASRPPRDQDVAAFDRRAAKYEQGAVARWHAQVVERTADIALAVAPVPLRILDVGCGTGALLREIVARAPYSDAYIGVDPAPRMLTQAQLRANPRLGFVRAAAEALPFPDAQFDLVVTCTSFDHWADQRRGVEELARVVTGAGTVVLVDLAAAWMPGRGRVRAPGAVDGLLADAGLTRRRRESVYRLGGAVSLVNAFIASR